MIKSIAEEGSIANSAEKLFLTQSALSHQLRELELQLGFKVFLRSRNKWILTEEGKELYKLGNDVLEKIKVGFEQIEQIKSGSKGNIKLSTECYSFYQGISGFIQKMGVLYPEITIDIILEATHQPIPKILSKEIDIAIVTQKPDHKDLEEVEVYNDEIFAIVNKENILSRKEFLSADDFKNEHLIIHSFPLETVSVYNNFLKPNKIIPKKISAVPLTEVALEMVEANMGLICVPIWAVNSFKISEELTFKKLGSNGVKRIHYIVFRKEDKLKKYINDFISNFEDHFSKSK
ncbi:LysR family transcriptional regulator [uncultured Tenacibaculum sp.]|uniref:LysR family transcriptional regulator n=1 Tax=uncultured Tenacibaculum sp. TaxID=174713 RepID=UPI002626D8F5|nr:LysR family transcriptional regulator [uncultured Tenacibaculum sp.]